MPKFHQDGSNIRVPDTNSGIMRCCSQQSSVRGKLTGYNIIVVPFQFSDEGVFIHIPKQHLQLKRNDVTALLQYIREKLTILPPRSQPICATFTQDYN